MLDGVRLGLRMKPVRASRQILQTLMPELGQVDFSFCCCDIVLVLDPCGKTESIDRVHMSLATPISQKHNAEQRWCS